MKPNMDRFSESRWQDLDTTESGLERQAEIAEERYERAQDDRLNRKLEREQELERWKD